MLRLFRKLLAITAVVAAVFGGAWLYLQRDALGRFWACHRVGAAQDYSHAKEELAWFTEGPDRAARLHELVTLWDTGNETLDRNLVMYLQDPDCDDSVREAFSLELAWRPKLLSRWAHCWCHMSKLEPDENFESIISYVDTLAMSNTPREITWRDVLDLQAAFELAGCPELAIRLTPENYLRRHADWVRIGRPRAAHLQRPGNFFPR